MRILRCQAGLRKTWARAYTALIKKEFGSFGAGSIVWPPFTSSDVSAIYVGDNCTIAEGARIRGIASYAGKRFTPRLLIGDGTYIGRNAHIIACLEMRIGRNVVMADGIYITDNIHGYEDIGTPILAQELKTRGPVILEDEVWLGERVCVLPDVTIGRHTVIGSNAVVTKSIPPYSVAVGNPAKVIRQFNRQTGKWEKVP